MADLVRPHQLTDESTDAGWLLLTNGRPAWMADAACREAPRRVSWFPRHGQNAGAAKAICAGCLAYEDCLMWSLQQGPDLDGVWAGLGQRERNRMRAASPGLIDTPAA